ncbi:MAG: tRNA (N(6)-L-threonylcarbamoyladenosine(37)-C(2))-methylthiotransferase MtaB [Alloprevotella sp.]|nr:tRNA (N(6)-L-threonylcarbamoyladenosine(37)-C(2))-methylthiotransferase MtaB [Alloprevotella sp.]
MNRISPSTEILRTAVYHTLGCKLNFAETASLRDALCKRGIVPARRDEAADLCVVNTCSVTDVADQKCRQLIRRFARQHPQALIVVMGCYAQLQPEVVAALPGVGLVVGQREKGRIVELIEERLGQHNATAGLAICGTEGTDEDAGGRVPFVPSCSRGDRTRYFLKVQDGCNYFCTYCTIPMARGRSRNGSIASLTAQAREVAAQGGKEIVITGVNIGDFGRTTGETFLDLIRALDTVEGVERYRISSIEPNLLTDEIIDFCATSRAFMPHFHIPLQSGSDEVLRLMRRRYDTELFLRKVEHVRAAMPDAFIGVDVIVGTRGETEKHFAEAYSFMQDLDVAQFHVFSYSERPGTKALEIPHIVAPEEKHARSQQLLALSEKKRKAFYGRFMGTRRTVLWEHTEGCRTMHGFTDNYVRVEMPTGKVPPSGNTLQEVGLGDFTPEGEALLAEA